MHRAARYAEADVVEAIRAWCQSGIFVADIEAPQKSKASINDDHLAVVAPVEPTQTASERGDIERNQLDTLVRHVPEIVCRGVDAADVVVNQQDPHTAPDRFCKERGESGAGLVVADNIEFDEDKAFR